MPIRQQTISQLHNAESQIERKMTLPTKLPAQFIAAFFPLFPLEHHHNWLVVARDVLRDRQGLPID